MKKIELKSELELFTFIDEYFESLKEDDIDQLLVKVLGRAPRTIFEGDSTDYTLSEVKLTLGAALKKDFIKGIPMIKPTGLSGKKYLNVLNRETTPEQIEYLRWLWENKKSFFRFSDSDYENIEHPDYIKAYLLSEDY